MENVKDLLTRSVMAGVAISTGCIVFLKVGGLAGAVVFTFGLLTVVHYKLKLYTGTAGFIHGWKDLPELMFILLGNIIGCLLCALFIRYAMPDASQVATGLLTRRLEYDFLQSTILGVGCGFIMTTAVEFGREGRYLPLLFGVPLFIMAGFLHSIADAFYYLVCPPGFLADNWLAILLLYVSIVIGNFIGCNLYRIVRRLVNMGRA